MRACISAGDGIDYDPATGVITADLSGDAGNALIIGGDGGLYAPSSGGGGGLTAVTSADSNCIDFAGLGTAGSPLTASPIVDPVAGNLMSCTATGMRATLAVGAGMSGNGTAGSPVAPRVSAWPYPCDVDTFAGRVYVDGTGTLRADPRGAAFYDEDHVNLNYPDLAVPTGFDNIIETRPFTVTNPDTCRDMFLIIEVELDVDFVIPPGAGASSGITTDEMTFIRNTGPTLTINDQHIQVTKVHSGPLVAPGANFTYNFVVTMGRPGGATTYNRIQTFTRIFGFIL